MLASTFLIEGAEGVISPHYGLVTRHLVIRLNAMFQVVELPEGMANQDSCLTNVDEEVPTLWVRRKG